jgi:hypothetical protein
MSAEFTMGARASCTDGFCGVITRAILDPAAETVTHLVIQPRHGADEGRLVPIALVDEEAGEIRLRCTLAEFGALEPAEEVGLGVTPATAEPTGKRRSCPTATSGVSGLPGARRGPGGQPVNPGQSRDPPGRD